MLYIHQQQRSLNLQHQFKSLCRVHMNSSDLPRLLPTKQNLLHLITQEVQHFHPQPRHLPKGFQNGSMTEAIVRGSVQLSMMLGSLHLHWFGQLL